MKFGMSMGCQGIGDGGGMADAGAGACWAEKQGGARLRGGAAATACGGIGRALEAAVARGASPAEEGRGRREFAWPASRAAFVAPPPGRGALAARVRGASGRLGGALVLRA